MKNIEELLKREGNKRMLVIFPHPDDESFASAGVIMKAKSLGYEVTLLTLTRGGAGRISINPKGRSLKEIRSEELMNAAKILGVNDLIIKDFDDGKLKPRNGWSKVVKSLLIQLRPGVVVTYDPTGFTGHPDHITLTLKLKQIIEEASISKPILLWVTLFDKYIGFLNPELRPYLTKADYELKMTIGELLRKFRAMFSHRSQRYEKIGTILLGMLFTRKEWYHKVSLGKSYPFKYVDFKI